MMSIFRRVSDVLARRLWAPVWRLITDPSLDKDIDDPSGNTVYGLRLTIWGTVIAMVVFVVWASGQH